MKNISDLPRAALGLYPTPFYRLESVSARYGRDVYIKRDDLCGTALGGNKVRKLEFLLAQAQADGCDTVFTTGGAQSNHAALTAACAARLGMKAVLLLKRRGVTERKGNLVLDELFGAQVELIDTDSYDEIDAEMRRRAAELEQAGHKCCLIPVGGSVPLGCVGYVNGVREFTVQAMAAGVRIGHIVSAAGSGGTTAGLLLGARLFLPGAKVTGVAVCDDPSLFQYQGFEGDSFRGCTRVAALDVPLWTQLFTMNSKALGSALEELEKNIRAYRQAIEAGDTATLVEKLSYSAARKRKMNRLELQTGAVGREGKKPKV